MLEHTSWFWRVRVSRFEWMEGMAAKAEGLEGRICDEGRLADCIGFLRPNTAAKELGSEEENKGAEEKVLEGREGKLELFAVGTGAGILNCIGLRTKSGHAMIQCSSVLHRWQRFGEVQSLPMCWSDLQM